MREELIWRDDLKAIQRPVLKLWYVHMNRKGFPRIMQ